MSGRVIVKIDAGCFVRMRVGRVHTEGMIITISVLKKENSSLNIQSAHVSEESSFHIILRVMVRQLAVIIQFSC